MIAYLRRVRSVFGTVLQNGDLRRVQLAQADAGQGFDPSGHRDGYGLLGMRERIELLGGTLAVESAPGDGTRVMARLPARRRATTDGRDRSPAAATARTSRSASSSRT